LYRRITLTGAPKLHVVPDGIFAPSERKNGSAFSPSAEIANDSPSPVSVRAVFVVRADDGRIVGEGASVLVRVQAGVRQILRSRPFDVNISLWSVHTPSLYTLVTTLETDNPHTPTGELEEGDVVTTNSIGFRKTIWHSEQGLFLNDQHVHLRGFAHHEDFSG
jgi:beta-galactosidase/beta-glucuronidase